MLRNRRNLLVLSTLGAACWAAAAAMAVAGDNHVDGVVEPRLFVYLQSDPHDSAKFEQYRDVPETVALSHFNINWEKSKETFGGGTWVELDAVDLLQKDQRLKLGFGSRGLWKGEIKWSENPRRFGEVAHSPYTAQGNGVFTLDDTLQSAFAGGGAVGPTSGNPWRGQTIDHGTWDPGTKGAILRDALGDAPRVHVGYQRKTGSARFDFTPTKAWRLTLGAERQTRNGTKPSSQSFGFASVTELAAPVDWETNNLDLGVEYSRKHWVLGAKQLWSDFNNDATTLTWDNINRVADSASGPGRGQYSLGTDNTWRQWQLYFGANLPGHTRINATGSQSVARQNDPFLPMTINSVLLAGAHPETPASSLHGEIENQLLDFRINSRPLDWLRLKAWCRDWQQDNNTPMLVFDGTVGYDTSIATTNLVPPRSVGPPRVPAWQMRANLPYGYDKTNLGALAGFSPAEWVDIALSWEREDMDRAHSPVEDSRQDTWKLTADFNVTDHLMLRAGYWTQDRQANDYNIEYIAESFPNGESTEFGFNEGARKFYLTDRERDTWSLMADITANDKFAIYAEAQHSSSDYFDPNTGKHVGDSFTIMADQNNDGIEEERNIRISGRKDNDESSYTLGFSITPNDDWEIHLDHTWEQMDWRMASRLRPVTNRDIDPGPGVLNVGFGQDDPLNDWDNEVDDHYRTFTLGFHGKWDENKWEVTGDLTVSHATGMMKTQFVPGGDPSGDTALTKFPELDNDFTIATLGFERHLASGWDIGATYWYEKWTYDDWQSDSNAPYVGNPTQDPAMSDWIQLGLDFADYENHILMVIARYHF
jgi:MtrB/PioB family decaheme-associated outer membrane protein